MLRLVRRLFDFQSPTRPGEQSYFRVIEYVVVIYALWAIFTWVDEARMWTQVVSATGVAQWITIDWMLRSAWALVAIGVTAVICLLLGLFRVLRQGYLTGFACVHLLFVARFSQGKVSHGDSLFGFLLLFLGLAYVLYTDDFARRRFFWGLAHFYLGFIYILSAFSKLIATGPSWVSGEHLWMWILERRVDIYSQTGMLVEDDLKSLLLENRLLATGFLSSGLFLEMCGFLLWLNRTRPVMTLVFVSFHFGVWLTLDIAFLRHALLLCLLGLPLEGALDRVLHRLRRRDLTKSPSGGIGKAGRPLTSDQGKGSDRTC